MKLGIVTSEGGMKCSYSVGAILALIDKFGLGDVYVVVGSSGSTGTLAYYTSRQFLSFRIIWQDLLTVKKFLSKKRLNKIIDIDYMIDEVFSKQEPLDTKKIAESTTKLFITVTDAEKGDLKYFSNREGVNILEAIRASCAIPLAYNKRVKIDGRDYIDGSISSNLSINIQKAFDEGAEKVIAVHNTGLKNDWSTYLFAWLSNYNIRQKILAPMVPVENSEKLFIIRPSKKLIVRTLDNKREHIKSAIDLGYEDVMGNIELSKFLEYIN